MTSTKRKGLLDEKGRLFGKVSIIDLTIVLLIAVAAVGATIRFSLLDAIGITRTELSVRYTVELQGVRDWTLGNIQIGDEVFSGGSYVGTVVNTWYEPMERTEDTGGKVWTAIVPEHYVLFVEIEGNAHSVDERYLIGGVVPLVVTNSSRHYTTKFAGFHGTLYEFTIQ